MRIEDAAAAAAAGKKQGHDKTTDA